MTVGAPGQHYLPAPEPQGSSRSRGRWVLVGLVVPGLALVAVVNVRDQREQDRREAAAEAHRNALDLTVRVTGGGNQQGGDVRSWSTDLTVDAGDNEFTVLSARLDRPEWVPGWLGGRLKTSHDLVFALSGHCKDVASAEPPTALLLRLQSKAGKVVTRRLDVDGQELLQDARRDCGLAGVFASLSSSVTAVRRSGDAVLLDLHVSNGSVDPATLTSVGVADAHVTFTPRLPLPLAPFVDGAPTKAQVLHLAVRFDRCPTVAPEQEPQLDVTVGVRDAAGRDVGVGTSEGRASALLAKLIADRCR